MSDLADRTGNVSLTKDDGTSPVDVIADGSLNRLAVDANVTGGVTLQRFTPNFQSGLSNTALNTSTDVTLFTISGDGQLDFIAVAGSLSSFELALVVDGVEKIRATMNDIGTTLGLSNATNVPFWVETANKNFRYYPSTPIDFTTSIALKAKATSGTPTVNWMVAYREIV